MSYLFLSKFRWFSFSFSDSLHWLEVDVNETIRFSICTHVGEIIQLLQSNWFIFLINLCIQFCFCWEQKCPISGNIASPHVYITLLEFGALHNTDSGNIQFKRNTYFWLNNQLYLCKLYLCKLVIFLFDFVV